MEYIRFTASARLGLWDYIPGYREENLSKINKTLQKYSHGTIESENEFKITSDQLVESITAICDKITIRGNPTLVDYLFEQALLNSTIFCDLNFKEEGDCPEIIRPIKNLELPWSIEEIIKALEDMFCMPYQSKNVSCVNQEYLDDDYKFSSSHEEDLFVKQFNKSFSLPYHMHLHRQVLIRDLVNSGSKNSDVLQGRVDFALHIGNIKWVFEVDGIQHNEKPQENFDSQRDKVLNKNDWKVYRVSASQVRDGLDKFFIELKINLTDEEKQTYEVLNKSSIKEIIANSKIYNFAYYYLLVPHFAHRCLRGLIKLYSYGLLNPCVKQHVLVIEEDIPVITEAFRMLITFWKYIHALSPETPPEPELEIDIIHTEPLFELTSEQSLTIHSINEPRSDYDLVISNSCFLTTGLIGVQENKLFSIRPNNFIAIRQAIGDHANRELSWSKGLNYELNDIEQSILEKNSEQFQSELLKKRQALIYFLHLIFRKKDFKEGQLRVISRLLVGKDAIVLLPTGGGKSLTYQLSGLLMPGMTIIIDPLISLMLDQVENLESSGIDMANYIASSQSRKAKDFVLDEMKNGKLCYIFLSPERLQSDSFRKQIQEVVYQFPISLAVIDEAHCVSEWGHDFRTSYLHLPRNLLNYCSNAAGDSPTLVSLTGTASFAVLTDIQIEMGINDEQAIILPKSFDRKELNFLVKNVPARNKSAALKALKKQIPIIMRSNPQQFYDINFDKTNGGIIFCPHINGSLGVTDIAHLLGHNNYFSGSVPKAFDGDSQQYNKFKKSIQHKFKNNEIQEIVATKSFGMGFDKPNIRYTIHYGSPQSVEAFYQEAGRAGRNGIKNYALCSILYSDDNWETALEIIEMEDHQKALKRLDSIYWDDRGDLIFQLWFIFNSYKGKKTEKEQTYLFWKNNISHVMSEMSSNATNTIKIVFSSQSDREVKEKAIFRHVILGLIKDYTVDYSPNQFNITLQNISPDKIKTNLYNYIKQYKFEEFATDEVKSISTEDLDSALITAIDILIDFVYKDIVSKRKQALRTMGDLCRNFSSDQEFRDAILAYLQESEFSDELIKWVNKPFGEIEISKISGILDRVKTLDEAKRLVGTSRRMLDEDPNNLALRVTSMCARAQGGTESDSSVIQEVNTLINQIVRENATLHDPEYILYFSLEHLYKFRPNLIEDIGDLVLRKCGEEKLAKLLLKSAELYQVDLIRNHAINLLLAKITNISKACSFWNIGH